MQGNKIAALDPSQEADKVLTRSPKPANSEDSDPMDFDNKVLETLAHLDHAPTPPTINKISPILPPQPKPESWFVREERKKDRRRSWGQLFMRHKVFLNELSLGSEGYAKNNQIESIEMKKN